MQQISVIMGHIKRQRPVNPKWCCPAYNLVLFNVIHLIKWLYWGKRALSQLYFVLRVLSIYFVHNEYLKRGTYPTILLTCMISVFILVVVSVSCLYVIMYGWCYLQLLINDYKKKQEIRGKQLRVSPLLNTLRLHGKRDIETRRRTPPSTRRRS